MYQINKRFFIGVGIVELVCIITWAFCAIGMPIWIAAITMLVLNSAYFLLFFLSLKALNDNEAALKKKDEEIGEDNIVHITEEQAKQFRKEGALLIDGKEYINQEHPIWKKNQSEQ